MSVRLLSALSKGECIPEGSCCVAVEKASVALKNHFKHDTFRPGQLESVVSYLHGRDVFIRMATGSGKTLCMFLGPLALGDNSCAVIISPLISLMEQQV